jgi:hypothetical protein
MAWTALPNDMVEVVLGNLSAVELAGMSATCTSVNGLSRRLMDAQWKAQCDEAIVSCGRARIACIVALIAHYLQGNWLTCYFSAWEWTCAWVSADGMMHGPAPHNQVTRRMSEDGDFRLSLCVDLDDSSVILFVEARHSAGSYIKVQTSPDRKQVSIDVVTTRDADFHVVALVQAMLSEGLAQLVRHAGKLVVISIRGKANTHGVTQRGIKSLISPLMPFATCCGQADVHVAERDKFEEHVQFDGTCTVPSSGLGDLATSGPQYGLLRDVVCGSGVTPELPWY